MRTFVAIELPQPVREALTSLADRLRASGARAAWARPDSMHLTLRFLGELTDGQVQDLSDRLTESYAGAQAFTLEVAGVGAFPNARRPSVVWAAVGPMEGGLKHARDVAERAAQSVGIQPETKPFHPHLTVARIKDPAQGRLLVRAIETEQLFRGGTFAAKGAKLFSSRLTPAGPIHEIIREYPFV